MSANMTTWSGFQSEPKGALEEVSRDRADLFLLQGLCMGCFLCLSGSLQGHTERETGLLAALMVSTCFFMPESLTSVFYKPTSIKPRLPIISFLKRAVLWGGACRCPQFGNDPAGRATSPSPGCAWVSLGLL